MKLTTQTGNSAGHWSKRLAERILARLSHINPLCCVKLDIHKDGKMTVYGKHSEHNSWEIILKYNNRVQRSPSINNAHLCNSSCYQRATRCLSEHTAL